MYVHTHVHNTSSVLTVELYYNGYVHVCIFIPAVIVGCYNKRCSLLTACNLAHVPSVRAKIKCPKGK